MVTTYIYYNMDTKQICDYNGVSITNRPEISFGGNPTWIIYLIDEKGYAWPTTGITSWKAAVAFDLNANRAPACRTVSSDITFSGCKVTVPIDANTTSFLNAVSGRETTYGWFELSGFDTDGNRICYLIFQIIGRMILDPDTTTELTTPATTSVNWSDINGKPTIPAQITYTVNNTASNVTSIAAGSNVTLSITNGVLTIAATGGTGSTDLTGYATQTWVTQQGYLTEHQSLTGYQTLITASNKLSYTLLSDTPTIPAGTLEIIATATSDITGTFNKTAAEMRSAIAAGKDLIVKLTSSGTVYTYNLFYVTDTTDSLTIGFTRSISGTNAPSDEIMEWYSDSDSYNIHERESEEAFRLYLMPTASSTYANRLFQYCGVTNENYTEGHFYKVTGSEGAYTWQEVTLSGNASSVSITDSGSYFTSTHVEGALQEIGSILSGLQSALEAI